jgi:hypothetical protein
MSIRLACCAVVIAACSTSPSAAPVSDAAQVPRSVAGIFRVTSSYELAQVPLSAGALLADLASATDDPDDPGRFLVEQLVAALPDPELRAIAHELEPVLAAGVQAELQAIAPKLAPGIVAIARGLERDARQLETHELWRIQLGGAVDRVVTGVGLDGVDISFADVGMPDGLAAARMDLGTGGQLAITEEAMPIAYGAILRLALDRAVIPQVVPGTGDLAQALGTLVDCQQLGTRVQAVVGIGPVALYTAACRIALTQAADRFYARLAAIAPATIDTTGTAVGIDHDRDGTMDEIRAGMWSGTLDGAPFGIATFSGEK